MYKTGLADMEGLNPAGGGKMGSREEEPKLTCMVPPGSPVPGLQRPCTGALPCCYLLSWDHDHSGNSKEANTFSGHRGDKGRDGKDLGI